MDTRLFMDDVSAPAFVRILATSDVHMHVKAHDYFADSPLPTGALEALAPVIASARREAEANGGVCVLVDNGDLLQGTPLAEKLATDPTAETPHPVAQVINALSYDALGLGNHDFDYGLDYLAKFATDVRAAVVSSNLRLNAPADWLMPTVMLDKGGVQIGLLSVLPQRTEIWAHAHLNGRGSIADMTQTCREAAAQLRAEGADVVIALAHTGIGTCPQENALSMIAAEGAVDALIGGHTHARLPLPGDPECLNGIPAVIPGYAAEVLGCIDLHLSRTPDSGVTITQTRAQLLAPDYAAPTCPDAAEAFAFVDHAHRATCAALDEPLGATPYPLTTYMAQIQPTYMLDVTAAAMQAAMRGAIMGTEYDDLPVLAAVSPSRCGGTGGPLNYTDIPAGPLRRRHVAELHFFPNDIWGVPVTGAELRDWLERAAFTFSAPEDRAAQGLLSPEAPGFDFDTLYGLDYEIDPSGPARFTKNGVLVDPDHHRIHNLTHAGKPITDADRFLVATSSYRASGGGQFPGLHPKREILRADLAAPSVMRDFVVSGLPDVKRSPWRFSGRASGLHSWFDTGPGARDHLADIANLSPKPTFTTLEGFLRVEITL